MNKRYYIIVIILSLMIIPQVTFAAWWNPVSWFDFFFHQTTPTPIVEVIPRPTPVIDIPPATTTIETLATSSPEEKVNFPKIQQTYQDTVNQALDIFLAQNSKYTKKNDPNDILWNKFQKIIQSGKYDIYTKTPEQLIAIFKRIDQDVMADSATTQAYTPLTIDTLPTTAEVSSEDVSWLRWYCTLGKGESVCTKKDFFEAYYSNSGLRLVINDLAKKQRAQATKDQLDAQWLEYRMAHPIPSPTYTPTYPTTNYQVLPQNTAPKTPTVIFGKGTSYTDSLGITHFTGSNGYSGTANTDTLGTTHYSDNNGNSGNCYTNTLGTTNCYGSGGSQTSSYTDNLGTTHYNGGSGFSESSYTDSLGITHFTNSAGASLSCSKDSLGMTHCN